MDAERNRARTIVRTDRPLPSVTPALSSFSSSVSPTRHARIDRVGSGIRAWTAMSRVHGPVSVDGPLAASGSWSQRHAGGGQSRRTVERVVRVDGRLAAKVEGRIWSQWSQRRTSSWDIKAMKDRIFHHAEEPATDFEQPSSVDGRAWSTLLALA